MPAISSSPKTGASLPALPTAATLGAGGFRNSGCATCAQPVAQVAQALALSVSLGSRNPALRRGSACARRPPTGTGLTSRVRLAQPILDREIRRALVPRFKSRIRRGISRVIVQIKPELRPAFHGSLVVPCWWRLVIPCWWRLVVAGRWRLVVVGLWRLVAVGRWGQRHAPSSIEIPAASATVIFGFGDR